MNNNKIGVFDSGVGGLTAIRAMAKYLPQENVVYFGDTEHMPYGGRSFDTIAKLAHSDFNFMKSHDVKLVIVACGTVSSVVLPQMTYSYDFPIIGVVESAASAAVKATKNGRVGIIATAAAVRAGAYAATIKAKMEGAAVFANAAPLFVPLVENGRFARGDKVARLAAEEYLEPLLVENIDTLILGCTHYPFLADIISDICGLDVTLIDPAAETVKCAKDTLCEAGLLSDRSSKGTTEFYVSSDIESFKTLATIFLGSDYNTTPGLVDIDKFGS